MDSAGTDWSPAEPYCKQGYKTVSSIKDGEFLDYMSSKWKHKIKVAYPKISQNLWTK